MIRNLFWKKCGYQCRLAMLEDLRQKCTLETFGASFMAAKEISGNTRKTGETTNLIRKHTRLYRETWILPLIDAMIRHEKQRLEKHRNKRVPKVFEK